MGLYDNLRDFDRLLIDPGVLFIPGDPGALSILGDPGVFSNLGVPGAPYFIVFSLLNFDSYCNSSLLSFTCGSLLFVAFLDNTSLLLSLGLLGNSSLLSLACGSLLFVALLDNIL